MTRRRKRTNNTTVSGIKVKMRPEREQTKMRKKISIITLAILLSSAVAVAQEQQRDLKVTLDVTYLSKYIDKGGRYFGNQSAFAELLDINLYDTGFGLLVQHRSAASDGYENKKKFKYGAYWRSSFFDDQSYKTTCKVTWYYHNYIDEPRDKGNKNEWILDVAWPKILPGGFVPKYTTWYMYPGGSGWQNRNCSGWLHRIELGYDLNIPEISEQPLHLSAAAWYRDGMGGGTKDHDWSQATFGVSTNYKLAENLSFIPALYYQSSWDNSVNEHDELYCKLTMRYKF